MDNANVNAFVHLLIPPFMIDEMLLHCCRIFRDVPSDITIEVNGAIFSLHRVFHILRI